MTEDTQKTATPTPRDQPATAPQWGVFLPTFSASAPIDVVALREMAIAVDRSLALDYVFVGDHLVWNHGILAPMATLAHLAAVTERVCLGPGVYLLPLRHPVITAKDVATVDRLSGGRLVMGIGAGGENPNEYRAAGIEPGDRGRRMHEAIVALKQLLTGHAPATNGRFVSMPTVEIAPTPDTRVPLWVGGRADAAIDRAAALAEGWFPVWVSPERYATARARVLEAREPEDFTFALNVFVALADSRAEARGVAQRHMESAYALPFDKFERYVAYGSADDVRATVQEYRDAGAAKIILNLTGPVPERQLHLVTSELLAGWNA